MPFQEVEGRGDFPPTLTLSEGDSLTGILLAAHKVTVDGAYGKRETTVYYLQVEGGVEVTLDSGESGMVDKCALWGSVDLDSKLGSIPPPARVKVTYTGKQELEGGRSMKVYSVQRDTDWNPSQLAAEVDIPF